MVFNATFNNISVISWRSALLVEETGVPGENHRPRLSGIRTLNLSGDRHLLHRKLSYDHGYDGRLMAI